MRASSAAAFVIAAMTQLGLSKLAEANAIECAAAAVAAPTSASDTFDTYCGRCHKAKELAAKYFSGVTVDEAVQREGELATFLDRHSACPHRHHEEIATWLREIANPK